jgi:4-hydroxy-3-polyprenylbenzoate decarboxylase
MGYKSLAECVNDLEQHGHLIRIKEEVDPYLEMAAIHLRVYEAQGPALLFENVKGSEFPAVSNLFGTSIVRGLCFVIPWTRSKCWSTSKAIR